jgi:hypothetical protein
MQYRLRTLLIMLALLPPVLAGAWYLFAFRMNPLFTPGISIPAAAILSSFFSASFVGLLFHDSGFTCRTVLAATMASAIYVFGGLMASCSRTHEPYFPLDLRPVSGWGGVALFICLKCVFIAGLVFGFIFAFIGFIWGLRPAGKGDMKPVPSPVSSFAPAVVQALIGMMWLIQFLYAIRKLIFYWDGTFYSDATEAFPTLTLSVVYLLHAYGLLRRQLWAKWVALLIAIPAAVVLQFGMPHKYSILAAAIMGGGPVQVYAPIFVAWLLLVLVLVGSQCFVAYATVTRTRDSDRTPVSRMSAMALCGWVLAASFILLAVVSDVSISKALRSRQVMHASKPYLEEQRKAADRLKLPQEHAQQWVSAFDRRDQVGLAAAETQLEQLLPHDSGAIVTAIRFRAKSGPHARRMALLNLLARPAFAVRSSPAVAHEHCQVAQQAYALVLGETNPDDIRQVALAIICNQNAKNCPSGSLDSVEAALGRLNRLDPIVVELERLANATDSPIIIQRTVVRWLQKLAPRSPMANEALVRLNSSDHALPKR